MSGTEERQFIYRASGVGVGGRITDPPHGDIPAQASAALPPDGGRAEARVSPYNFAGILNVEAAYTVITGNPGMKDGKPSHRTATTTTVIGLNVEGVVKADSVLAELVSEQPAGLPELQMRPLGRFTNLRIKDVPIDPKFHEHLIRAESKSQVDKCLEHLYNPYDKNNAEGKATPIGSSRPRYLFSIFEDDSIAEQVKKIPGAKAFPGGRIRVDGFGDIYLGEFLVDAESRRLTVLRIVLGSPPSGPLNFCSVEGNGSPPP